MATKSESIQQQVAELRSQLAQLQLQQPVEPAKVRIPGDIPADKLLEAAEAVALQEQEAQKLYTLKKASFDNAVASVEGKLQPLETQLVELEKAEAMAALHEARKQLGAKAEEFQQLQTRMFELIAECKAIAGPHESTWSEYSKTGTPLMTVNLISTPLCGSNQTPLPGMIDREGHGFFIGLQAVSL